MNTNTTQPKQPAHVDRPVDNTPAPSLPPQPAAPITPVEPAATTPPTPPQVPLPNDENNPPAPPADSFFNTAPAPPMPTTPPAPAAKPAVETPAAPPAAPPATPPASSDDLFGTAPSKAAEPAAPAAKPAEPAAPPAAPPVTPPASSSDDLFGGALEKPAAPAAAPAEKAAPPVTPPATPPADKPAAKPEDKEKKADDIFGVSPAVLRESGGLASDEMRLWTDDTGNFSCHGRLVRIAEGQVKLMKDNGRSTTVPISRLSVNDLEFVNRQASAEQASVFQTAQSISVMPWMAN